MGTKLYLEKNEIMYTAIIIDDEHKLRELLAIKLAKSFTNLEILAKCESAEEGYDKIVELQPNIVFLDIQMPGENGFELLTRFDDVDFEIIFVTGYDTHGLDALKVSAVDYILKPINSDDLNAAVEKAMVRIDKKEKLDNYDVLKSNFENLDRANAKIAIPSMSSYEFLMINDIVRIEGWQKYTKIFVEGEKVIVSSYNLGIFRDLLEKYSFYQPHKSHIININKITRYLKEGTLIMTNGDEVPVSRRKKEEFLSIFVKQNLIN